VTVTTAASTVVYRASVPAGLLPLVSGPRVRAMVIGRFPTAVYLDAGDEVVALLTRDAVHIPCGLVLPFRSTERSLAAAAGPAHIGDGEIAVGAIVARAGRVVSRVAPALAPPAVAAVDEAARRVPPAAGGVDQADAAALMGGSPVAAVSLVGRGAGLTPAGDDVLAGFLVAAHAYRLDAPDVQAVATEARGRTTRLSVALLQHAARGESVPELTDFLLALDGRSDLPAATDALLGIGHSSGTALAIGALVAARMAATTR
jgi:Protein of unknown function (DUF2877)